MAVMTWNALERFRIEHWCKLLQRHSPDKQRERRLQPLPEMTLNQDCTLVDTYSISKLVEQYDHKEVVLVMPSDYDFCVRSYVIQMMRLY